MTCSSRGHILIVYYLGADIVQPLIGRSDYGVRGEPPNGKLSSEAIIPPLPPLDQIMVMNAESPSRLRSLRRDLCPLARI